MNQIWECEFCHKQFRSADECHKHEKKCSSWDKDFASRIIETDGWVEKTVFVRGFHDVKYFPKELTVTFKSGRKGVYTLKLVDGEIQS